MNFSALLGTQRLLWLCFFNILSLHFFCSSRNLILILNLTLFNIFLFILSSCCCFLCSQFLFFFILNFVSQLLVTPILCNLFEFKDYINFVFQLRRNVQFVYFTVGYNFKQCLKSFFLCFIELSEFLIEVFNEMFIIGVLNMVDVHLAYHVFFTLINSIVAT